MFSLGAGSIAGLGVRCDRIGRRHPPPNQPNTNVRKSELTPANKLETL
jgi:hypothetical protein